MEDDNELYEKTKALLQALNHFLIHIVIYFVCNAIITIFIFQDLSARWEMFIIIVFWAIVLIYHALRVYGVNPINGNNKKLSKMWGWI